MKFVHCMILEEKFTKGVSHFYDRYFAKKNHTIYYFSSKNDSVVNFQLLNINYKILKKSKYNLKRIFEQINQLKKYDYIVFHSLFINEFYKIFFLLQPKLMKKIIWIEWGYDLYTRTKHRNLIRRMLHNYFCSKIPNFIAIFPPDIDVYKNIFKNSNTRIFYAPYIGYPPGYQGKFYDPSKKISDIIKSNDTIYIQIGHNAMPSLNHIEVLYELKRYAKENIKIILPLSYGENEIYIDKVEKCAKELFGEKAVCLRKFLSSSDYFNIVNKVSIAIFNTERQCALGNIYHMIFNNVKLYMPRNSVMFKYFNEKGVPVTSFEDIKKMNFEEFVEDVIINDVNKFDKFIYELIDYDSKVKLWEKIYNEIENNY